MERYTTGTISGYVQRLYAMNSPHYFSAKALNDEIIARLLKDEDRLVISKSFSSDNHCGWHITAPRYLWIKAGVHPVWIRDAKGNKLQSKVGTKRMKRARQLLSLSLQENKSISFTQPLPVQTFYSPLHA